MSVSEVQERARLEYWQHHSRSDGHSDEIMFPPNGPDSVVAMAS
jgi:hypothetical protein